MSLSFYETKWLWHMVNGYQRVPRWLVGWRGQNSISSLIRKFTFVGLPSRASAEIHKVLKQRILLKEKKMNPACTGDDKGHKYQEARVIGCHDQWMFLQINFRTELRMPLQRILSSTSWGIFFRVPVVRSYKTGCPNQTSLTTTAGYSTLWEI